MIRKNNIPDENFIPEGLEFKEEYFEKAIGMYQKEKTLLRWKKIAVFTGSIAAAACLIWFIVSPLLMKNEPTENNSGKNGLDINVSENQTSPSIHDQNTGHIPSDVSNEINSERSSMAEDQGALVSSGAGAPDQRPVENERALDQRNIASSGAVSKGLSPNHSKKAPGENGETSSGVDPKNWELTSFQKNESEGIHSTTELPIQEKNDEAPVLVLESGLQTGNVNSETDVEHTVNEAFVFSGEIKYRDAKFEIAESQLSRNTSIPFKQENRISWYANLGLNAWADYGRAKGAALPAGYFVEGGLSYQFHHGWSLSTGAHYYVVSGMSNPVVFENTTYGQGFNTTTQTILTNQLQYGGLQIGVKKNVLEKNQIMFGYSMDYLISGTNTITTTEYSSYEYYPEHKKKAKGYIKGFEDLNHGLVFGYQRLMGRYTAGIRGQLGLTDITKDGLFVHDNKDNNSMVTICLGIKLNK